MRTVSFLVVSGLTPSSGVFGDPTPEAETIIEEGNLVLESDAGSNEDYLLLESTGEPLILESTT